MATTRFMGTMKIRLELAADCGRMTGNPEVIRFE
jgi:hypothetical protein